MLRDGKRRISVLIRFWNKVDKTETCWLWTAYKLKAGYGRIRIDGKNISAHRWAYESMIAPIPEGLTIDHLCRNTSCVNPEHMEVVTLQENLNRAKPWLKAIKESVATRLNKSLCPKGHKYDAENTYVRPDRQSRDCKECRREACRRNYWRYK